MHKSRSSYRDGYQAYVAIEPDTGIITGCDLTPADIGGRARRRSIDAAEQALAGRQATSAWYSWPNDLFDQEIGPAVESVLRAREWMR